MDFTFQFCDSTLMKMCENTCQCSNYYEKTATTGNPEISNIVCGALIHFAIIVVCGLLAWQIIKLISNGIKSYTENKRAKEAKEFEVKCTYRTKALDYLKDELISFNTIHKKLDDAEKEKEDPIESVKQLLEKMEKQNAEIAKSPYLKALSVFLGEELKGIVNEETQNPTE